jgi:hypothetical protein
MIFDPKETRTINGISPVKEILTFGTIHSEAAHPTFFTIPILRIKNNVFEGGGERRK